MCGIAGIIKNFGQRVEPGLIQSMTRALTHRGPDDEGYFQNQEIALGVRRLSVIDLISGS